MKKIMISLLMVAASFNAMAITYSAKAKLTLTSADNKSCTLTIAQSDELEPGLNNGYYAELNTEGKDVQLYVVYNDVKYQQFASNPATMQDLQLGVKTNESTTYSMTVSNVTGELNIVFNGVPYTINAAGTVFSDVALPAGSTLPALGEEDKYRVQPSIVVPSLCFIYNILEVNGYEGKSLVVKQGETEVVNIPSLGATYSKDLSAYTGRMVVILDDEEYLIDANPTVTPVN